MSSPPPVQLEVEVGDDEPMDEDAIDILPDDRLTLPQKANQAVELWRAKLAEGVLAPTHFQDHWRVTVPRIYSPEPNRTCLDWSFHEELATRLLLVPLEQFVLGTSGDGPEQAATPRRSTLCGRVFKQGEPAYSCRECGMDNTCVLCVECFKVSAHRNHRYKMGQSNGGGCCDCGDTEAWKRDPFCELHAAPADAEQAAGVSADVVERMKIVATVCLNYCFRLLTHVDHSPALPNDLKVKDTERDLQEILDQPDCYCTVLYNDETHTFEQVITTLTRVMKCNHRDSVELVSLIDREGRALVKCNSFQVCDNLRSDIENRTAMFARFTSRVGSSLKVLVMHAHLVAHQTFAMKLLQWLQNFVRQEPSLRLAVSQVALGEESWGGGAPSGGVAGGVMQNDFRMWKSARTAWHRLLIATTLMDYSTKKAMAILFTKNYGSILKDFIRDDHDHSFSISSLSVQLYTTPTLAHHLIAKHDALFIVLNTFVSECHRRCAIRGRLEFNRNQVTMPFKRAQVILYDVKYLLGSLPTTFDDELRKGFLHGLSLVLNLLVMMQGMDSVIRQVGQHMEYEPEWESAFNLHVKLAHSISLALEWSAAERALLASAYRMALRRHSDIYPNQPRVLKELGGQSAPVIEYDVSTQLVSIHRPLSRFVAGLHLHLHRHGLSYHSREFERPDKPKPTPEELIEPVLQTMTMIAQVHAGMWRRNGFALLNQLYFYHNVKCRSEMYDRDVVMLQIGASLIESNEFIIHVLNKFDLLEWAGPDFDQSGVADDALRHTISMVEEFLGLLITVVGSRYMPGVGEVTKEDRTKKEIIQLLCVKPMPHSELNRSLPEDQSHETGLEAVIHEVAEFVKPASGGNRGVYKLRPHLYDEYDTFYYHYTREELSRSEEEQRNRRKAAGLAECCPPPLLPRLCAPFRLLASLLQSDAALHALATVLERALDLRSRSFSETQVHKALHLIGYAIRDEESGHYEFVAFAERAARRGLVALLARLAQSPRVDAHRPLARFLLAKLRTLLGQSDEGAGDGENMETDQQEKPTSQASEEEEKARRAKLAAERRAKVMAQMKAQMNDFISNNSTLFEETTTEASAGEQQTSLRALYSGAALGVWGGGVPAAPRVCIMCQEEARIELRADPIVLVAFVQNSTVLSRLPRNRPDGGTGPSPAAGDPRNGWAPAGLGAQPHVSTCGHALHATCWKNYVDTVLDKENRRPYRLRQPAAFDIEKKEYLCPLCERLCNTAVPLLSAPPLPAGAPPPLPAPAFQQAVELILNMKHQVSSEAVHTCTEFCEELLCQARARSVGAMSSDMSECESGDECEVFVSSYAETRLPADFLLHVGSTPVDYPETTKALVEDFAKILPSVCAPVEGGPSGGMAAAAALYRAVAYTVQSADMLVRAERRGVLGELPARLRDALQALTRAAAALPSIWSSPRHLSHQALTALAALETSSPLTYDAFGILVTLVLAAPSLFGKAAGPARPTHLARQLAIRVFRATLTRALIVVDCDDCTSQPMEEQEEGKPSVTPDLENLLTFMKELRRGKFEVENLNPDLVWERIKAQCHGFLRCCCLFFHFLSDIIPPTELTVVDGDTWETMCGYLDLPMTFKELIDNETARARCLEWSTLSGEWFDGEIAKEVALEPLEPPKLMPLPDDFSVLMNVVSEFTCPNSEREDSKYPTMCLVCGQVLCSQSYCCQRELRKSGRGGGNGNMETVGAVVWHALQCGGGAGLFLRVRECELLLLAAPAPARGALLPAPYLDSYGETDQGLRRGNPLHLCASRYEQQRMLWLGHGLQERIARALDTNMLVTTPWHNM